MTQETEYQRRIAHFDGPGLVRLWEQIEARSVPESEWAPGKALEYLVLRAFELEGAEVRWPYLVKLGDAVVEQIDGVVYSGGLCCVVECKDQKDNQDYGAVAKLRSQLLRRPAGTIGAVFSRTDFTQPAVILAQFTAPQCIVLWSGPEIGYAIRNRRMCPSLLAKYRHWVEHAWPFYNINIPEEIQ
jgi:hypothetical protein